MYVYIYMYMYIYRRPVSGETCRAGTARNFAPPPGAGSDRARRAHTCHCDAARPRCTRNRCRERASEVNTWRAIVDIEALKIVTAVRHSLATMTDWSKQQFVGNPEYVAFYGQVHDEGPVQAGNKKMRTN